MAVKWLGSLLGDNHDPLEMLADYSRNKTPVRVEIEGANVRFLTQLTLKKGSVVLAKPVGLKTELHVNSVVRLRPADDSQKELRLKVITPHFNLSSGNAVFICEAPEGEVAARRQADRFDVTRYNNLRLVVGGEQFRLVDVSKTGFKVMTNTGQAQHYFPIGKELHAAHIMLGSNARVDLVRVVPRAYHITSVGCEFDVKRDGASERYLEHLVDSLTKAETERMAT
jgi:hypothetical protein